MADTLTASDPGLDGAGLDEAGLDHLEAPAPLDAKPRPRRWARFVSIISAVLVLAATSVLTAVDLATRSQVHQAESLLVRNRHALAGARQLDGLTTLQLHGAAGTVQAFQPPIANASHDLANLSGQLGTANRSLFFQSLDLTNLEGCLNGIQSAYRDIATGELAGVAPAITGSSAACQLVRGGNAGGLAYPFDFPDPFVLRLGGTYYGYATNSAAGNIQIITSTDLMHWTTVGNALPSLPVWATGGTTWAPSVAQTSAGFVLYYSAGLAQNGVRCISVATSGSPAGPFVDSSTGPLICPPAGAIDPSPFTDGAGNLYLTWKSEAANGQPGTILSQPLTADGTALAPGSSPAALITATQAWEGSVVEGPTMILVNGEYLLFYSANDWETANYAIGIAQCSGPQGPCTKPLGGPILASDSTMAGPGGPTVFTDPQGNAWLGFHAWLPGQVGYPANRDLFLRRLDLSGSIPAIEPPPSG